MEPEAQLIEKMNEVELEDTEIAVDRMKWVKLVILLKFLKLKNFP